MADDQYGPDPEKYESTGVHMTTGKPVWRKFTNKQNWIDKARSWMSEGDLCIDSGGRELSRGADFDDAAYPVFIARPIGWPDETYEDGDAKCPWCGQYQSDTWEMRLEDGQASDEECDSCEKPIRVKCEVTVTYTTTARRDDGAKS